MLLLFLFLWSTIQLCFSERICFLPLICFLPHDSGSLIYSGICCFNSNVRCYPKRSFHLPVYFDHKSDGVDLGSPRIYIPASPLKVDTAINLEQDQARYLGQVLRLKSGAPVRIFNGQDGELEGEFAPVIKNNRAIGGQLNVKRVLREQEAEEKLDVWLAFAPIKTKRLKLLLEKATELGVDMLWPVVTENTAVARPERQTDKMDVQLVEASEQCERLSIPVLNKCSSSLEQLLAEWPQERKLYVCQERSQARSIMDELVQARTMHCGFLIGPEGGFSDNEINLLKAKHFTSFISLGTLVLRAETAAFYALTCWNAYRNGDVFNQAL